MPGGGRGAGGLPPGSGCGTPAGARGACFRLPSAAALPELPRPEVETAARHGGSRRSCEVPSGRGTEKCEPGNSAYPRGVSIGVGRFDPRRVPAQKPRFLAMLGAGVGWLWLGTAGRGDLGGRAAGARTGLAPCRTCPRGACACVVSRSSPTDQHSTACAVPGPGTRCSVHHPPLVRLRCAWYNGEGPNPVLM